MESDLSARDVMTTEYVGVSESDTVLGAVQLMREERVGCVVVVRGTEPVGIVTEWDVLGVVAEERDPGETTVDEVMTTPVISVGPDRPLTDATTTMARESIRNLLVEADGEVLGIVTQRDVIAATGSFQGSAASTGDLALEGEAHAGEVLERRPDEEGDELLPNGGDQYSTQGVCEACGSLADALREANGQLVCTDCRSV